MKTQLLGLGLIASAVLLSVDPVDAYESAQVTTSGIEVITTNGDSEVTNPWVIEDIDSLLVKLGQQEELEKKVLKLKPNIDKILMRDIVDALMVVSDKYQLDPSLILAIAYRESRLNPKARGLKGEYGLMQIMPAWANELVFVNRPEDLYKVDINIESGAYILADYMDQFKGNKKLALTAYNRGVGTVQVALMNGRNPSNGYAEAVLADYKRITH